MTQPRDQWEKKARFEDMLDWYEENHNGDWFEIAKFVSFEPANEPLFCKDKWTSVPDPMATPWILKRERD